jgi:UDP-N-acetylglucosamine:LPS N-acetylglucosamine transferase
MDLAALGKKTIFVPTPGQTEQEYLAEYLAQNGLVVYQKQDKFNLETAIARLSAISPLPLTKPNSQLKEALQALIAET